MKRKSTLALILTAILLLSLLSGCGAASDKATADSYVSNGYSAESAPMAPAEKPEMDYGYGAGMDVPADDSADAPVSGSDISGEDRFANAKLIYTANIELESTEFDAAVSGLEALVSDMGGYFEESYVNNYGSYRSGNYTVRVPAENFESFYTGVGELCQLNAISRRAQDISEVYYDTESRLFTQQTKLERLQELLAQAQSMEDIITLESAISDTELYIEQLTGTLRKYDSLVGFSTVTIYLQEVYKLTEVEEPVIGFGAKLAAAFKSGCTRFVSNLEDFLLIFARGWVGWLLFIVVVAVIVVLARRSARKKRSSASAEGRFFAKRRSRKANGDESDTSADMEDRGE